MSTLNRDVFINCPFDSGYLTCFEAIVFTIYVSGYEPVCALQDDHFGDVRLTKLKAMIESCDRTIHDLSRTESNSKGLPRFNMPFELGMAIGATQYGGVRQRRKRVMVMVKKRYVMAQFLSDAAGQDPVAHDGKPANVIRLVRNHLGHYHRGKRSKKERLPGPQHFNTLFKEFKTKLPQLAVEANLTLDEINSFKGGYLDFLEMLRRFTEAIRKSGNLA